MSALSTLFSNADCVVGGKYLESVCEKLRELGYIILEMSEAVSSRMGGGGKLQAQNAAYRVFHYFISSKLLHYSQTT